MGLRHAEVAASVKRLGARHFSSRLDRFEVMVEGPAGTSVRIEVELSGGISVVTGGNGAGKTTVLKALRALAADGYEDWPERVLELSAQGLHEGKDWQVSFARNTDLSVIDIVSEVGSRPPFVFIDPAEEALSLRKSFIADANAQDLLAGTDPAPFSDALLAQVSHVLRRNYDFINVYEVEGFDGDTIRPWFDLSANGTAYSAGGAGRGELSGLYLLWRLHHVESDSIVVIDEPEAWLASYSQSRLKETLAYLSVERGLHFVISTHSPDLYLGIPGDMVTVLRGLPEPKAFPPMGAREAARNLGAASRPMLAVFTEDAAAAAITRTLLRRFALDIVDSIEVFHAENGESALLQTQNEYIAKDRRSRVLRLAIVLDGDQRQMNGDRRIRKDKRLYLPGNTAPERSLRRAVEAVLSTASVADLGSWGVADATGLQLALDALSGSDHHDWFVGLGGQLHLDYAATSDLLTAIAENDPSFSEDAKALAASLRELLSGTSAP